MATKKAAVETANVPVNKFSISAEALFEEGAHFGHMVKRWNPKMKKFIWGKKSGVHIFDLEKTVAQIDKAAEALKKFAEEGKRIAFVGSKRQAKEVIKEVALANKLAFVSERWLGGTISNWKQVKSRIDRLADLKRRRETGDLKKYTKREQVLFDREIAKLEKFFGGLSVLTAAPEVLVVVDSHKERSAVREAKGRGVKIVAIVDSNGNPDPIDYVIPMNDDSAKAIEMVIRLFGQVIKEAKTVKN